MFEKEMIIDGWKGKSILISLLVPEKIALPIPVIFIHGFKGFKDWGHFPLVLEALADSGIPAASFNFSHNGTTPEHPQDFVDLEAFGRNNYSIELEELGLVMDALQADGIWPDAAFHPEKFILVGHSRGGGMAILKAAMDERVAGLITWAAVSAFGILFDPSVVEVWKKQGVIHTHNARTGQDMPIYHQLYEDLMENKERLDILNAASQIKVPWQIVHGTEDATVTLKSAEELHAACPHSELIVIEGANHTFGGKHPWQGKELPKESQAVMEKLLLFVRQMP